MTGTTIVNGILWCRFLDMLDFMEAPLFAYLSLLAELV